LLNAKVHKITEDEHGRKTQYQDISQALFVLSHFREFSIAPYEKQPTYVPIYECIKH
jgi:hypothetical protein